MKFNNQIKVIIVGGGNVAYHLAKMFHELPQVDLLQLYNRSVFSSHFDTVEVIKTNEIKDLIPADVCFVAVADDAIAEVTKQLPFQKLVVHTSGNTPMNVINSKFRKGVFYPLQSFSKQKAVDFSSVPICVEAEHEKDYELLKNVASLLSQKVFEIDSEQRKYIHIAAVFANNFVNHLLYQSQQICKQHNIPFEILQPLIDETFLKAEKVSFYDAQADLPAVMINKR